MTSKYFQTLLSGIFLFFLICNFAYAQTATQTLEVTDSNGKLVSNANYGITNGTIDSAVVSPSDDALDITMTTNGDGVFTITLPRTLIDSTINGQDDQFFVLVDGQDVDFQESKTATDRTLTISFPDGTTDISIIGTSVAPEFGSITSLILVMSIIAIIVVTFRTRLNISRVMYGTR